MTKKSKQEIPRSVTQACAEAEEMTAKALSTLKALCVSCVQHDLDDPVRTVLGLRKEMQRTAEGLSNLSLSLQPNGEQGLADARTPGPLSDYSPEVPLSRKRRRQKKKTDSWSYLNEELIYECTTKNGVSYRHRAPREIVVDFVRACYEEGKSGKPFKWENLIESDKIEASTPEYQYRLALRWLVQSAESVRKVKGQRGHYELDPDFRSEFGGSGVKNLESEIMKKLNRMNGSTSSEARA